MTRALLLALLLAGATHPAKIRQIDYTLRIDAADMSVFSIDMHVHNAPATFTVAAAAHPEYDDKYWRYVEDMRVDGGGVTRADSSLWRISARPGDVVILTGKSHEKSLARGDKEYPWDEYVSVMEALRKYKKKK